MKKFYDTKTGKEITPGERVIIEIDFPKNLKDVGRLDKFLETLLEQENGFIEKVNKEWLKKRSFGSKRWFDTK